MRCRCHKVERASLRIIYICVFNNNRNSSSCVQLLNYKIPSWFCLSSNAVFPRWSNSAKARSHQSVNLSCSWWGILCRRRDVEHWFLHTMHLPQWPCPVWDWSLSTSSVSKPHPHTGLLLSSVPRYVLASSFHQSPSLTWGCLMFQDGNAPGYAQMVVVVPLFFSSLEWQPAVL